MLDKNLLRLLKYKKALYIEDAPEVRKHTTYFMQKFFGHVDNAENGKKGLELFEKKHYDIVFTDYKMPVLDGEGMLAKIKEHNGDIYTVMITASTSKEALQHSIADEVILKPIEFEAFLALLERYCTKELNA